MSASPRKYYKAVSFHIISVWQTCPQSLVESPISQAALILTCELRELRRRAQMGHGSSQEIGTRSPPQKRIQSNLYRVVANWKIRVVENLQAILFFVVGLFDGDFLVGLGHHLIWEDLQKLEPQKCKQLLLPDEYALFFRISLLLIRLNVLENPRRPMSLSLLWIWFPQAKDRHRNLVPSDQVRNTSLYKHVAFGNPGSAHLPPPPPRQIFVPEAFFHLTKGTFFW